MSKDSKDSENTTQGATAESKKMIQDLKNKAKETADEFKEEFKSMNHDNKRVLVGVLALLLGGLGIHKFVLGYTKEGVILLLLSTLLGFITCGASTYVAWLIGFVEGILYLSKSDQEFRATYQVEKKPWF